jgi:histidinol dehydrogenase
MKIIINPPREQWAAILKRPSEMEPGQEAEVAAMLEEIRETGWEKVRELTLKFDGYDPDPALVPVEDLENAGSDLIPALKEAIALAARNIQKFHQMTGIQEPAVEVLPGVSCYKRWMPIDRVGLYIPGGTAPLFSTVLMLAIPARLAGCGEIILCTPAGRDGKVHPAILYSAWYCGIRKVFRLGGVQAIGAMTFGSGPVPVVYKIFGPGNSWVTQAKQLATRYGVAIDMPAGPSEVAVIADASSIPAFVAADLLSQAEHGPDSQVLLLTTDWDFAEKVRDETGIRLHQLPRRDIARKALENSRIIVMKDDDNLMDLVNEYAPEHLIISTENQTDLAGRVRNAGSVFLGPHTPESAGDYASGTNHTLPTAGFARNYGGITVQSFMKTTTFQEITPEGLDRIGPAIIEMARAEGLEAHARAVEVRMTADGGSRLSPGQAPPTTDERLPTADCQLPTAFKERLPLYPEAQRREERGPGGEADLTSHASRVTRHHSQFTISFAELASGSVHDSSFPFPNLSSLVRPNIRHLVPYSSARDEFSGSSSIFLDANENPYDSGYNRYPDPRQNRLRELVAGIKGVKTDQVFLGNGSDEAIDLLIRIFCEPKFSRIITISPSYGMYPVCARIQDVVVDAVLLNDDFSVNAGTILDAVQPETRLIFLCSPNNPTGNQTGQDDIRKIAINFNGILVVDEAYIDFASGPSALGLLGELPNLVVLQTFSKAWGMAGVRVGMAFAAPEIISFMDKVKYPYNLSDIAVDEVFRRVDVKGVKGVEIVDSLVGARRGVPGLVQKQIEQIRASREQMAIDLKQVTVVLQVFSSEANFLLVKVTDARKIYRYLVDHGIVVRDRSNQPLCENCLRITIGTIEENAKLIEVLNTFDNPDS